MIRYAYKNTTNKLIERSPIRAGEYGHSTMYCGYGHNTLTE